MSPPVPVNLKNNASALQHENCVTSAISELLDAGQSMHSASRVKLFEYRHAKFSNRTQMYYGLKQTNKHKQGCCLQH